MEIVKKSGTRIASVSKAFAILDFVAAHPDGATATETAAALGIPVPTAYHLLNTLLDELALTKDTHRRYRLGPGIGALCNAYISQSEPAEYLRAPLVALATTTGETAYLSAWRGGEIEVVATEEGSRAVRVAGVEPGTQGHAHARASGKVLLAHAPEALVDAYLARHPLKRLTANTICDETALREALRRTVDLGYATDEEELTEGVACVSTPVIARGTVIAAYTFSAPVARCNERRADVLAAALDAARSAGAANL